MTAAETVDAALRGPVLVFGSLPPAGRDLDLLARPNQYAEIVSTLTAEGFLQKRTVWSRFGDCRAEVVDLVLASTLGLPAAELDALFADAIALDGFRRLFRPSPEHGLLLLARRVEARKRRVAERHLRKAERITAEDPTSWRRAYSRADAWDVTDALRMLQSGTTVDVALAPRAALECSKAPCRTV